jgi:phosphoribosylaminoimidazole-succinocarboxamide synthase
MTLIKSELQDFPLLHRGKVRDVYKISDSELLVVATDRISAFDCILPTPIPKKGEILTALSAFWFNFLSDVTKHHMITADFEEMPESIRKHNFLRNRSMIVKHVKIFPIECVVRGYLAGSGWKDYVATGKVCGHRLPEGLRESEKLPEPIFTPATKSQNGHDENISEQQMEKIIGSEYAQKLKQLSLQIYQKASDYALKRGLILADTKFEFGLDKNGEITLADEVLTPDSSRFWSLEDYRIGISPPSFDKQFVRDYLESIDWDKKPPAPELPSEIVEATKNRYMKAYQILTGKNFDFN